MTKTKHYMHADLQELLFQNYKDIIFRVAYGGRYGMKTTAFEDASIRYVLDNPGCNFLCVRGTQTTIKNSLLAGIKERIYALGLQDAFDIGEQYIKTNPKVTKSKVSNFLFMGAIAYENFRSLNNISVCWVDEAHVVKEEAWDVIVPSIRSKDDDNLSEIWISFNPKFKTDWVYKEFVLKNNPLAKVLKINYTDNPKLPRSELLKIEQTKKTDTRKYRHIYLGELDDEPIGALWNKSSFLYKDIDDFEHIVIAIDPAGDSKGNKTDICGIIVAGNIGDIGCIISDESEDLIQLDQAKKAIRLYKQYKADWIVVEKNGVGAGIKTIIHQIDKNIPVKEVYASKSKYQRAVPIAALYQANRIFHTNIFVDLEYEMTSWTEDSKKSPNRLDAAVHAFTHLFISKRTISPDDMVDGDMETMLF